MNQEDLNNISTEELVKLLPTLEDIQPEDTVIVLSGDGSNRTWLIVPEGYPIDSTPEKASTSATLGFVITAMLNIDADSEDSKIIQHISKFDDAIIYGANHLDELIVELDNERIKKMLSDRNIDN